MTDEPTGRPRPGPPRPGSPPPAAGRPATGRPAAGRPATAVARADGAGSLVEQAASWGRVGPDGTVYVRARSGAERPVGQWPGGEPAEALALYIRRFESLVVEVELLERRVREGALAPGEARTALSKVRDLVVDAAAVGDLEALAERVAAVEPLVEEQRARRRAAHAARQEEARARKEELVAEAERLAESDSWHAGADRLHALMADWKAQARLDKPTDDALWRRFSGARSTYTRRRKQHFAELHKRHDQARAVKQRLAGEAEALAESTDWAGTAARYRDLMREWKAAGAAGRRDEEALWRRFRGAQDTFFAARDASNAAAESQLAANAAAKRSILAEAEELLPVTDLGAARAAFRRLSERWDAAGKVPREAARGLENRMRAVESALQDAERERWRRSNPEARARAEATVAQLESSLAELRREASDAEAAGQGVRADEVRSVIEVRESWLSQARATLADVT